MNDDQQPLTASSESSHVTEPGQFEGYKGTLYSERPPESDPDSIWAVPAKPPAPTSKARGIFNLAVGIPLAIALLIILALVVVAIAFGVVGALGSALGLSATTVTVVAVIVAILV